jgi:hypothetical protein
MPKSGYINALDFKSPKLLADYLQYLDKNKTAYNSYFKWKRHISFQSTGFGFNPFCSMCIKLHLEERFGIEKKVMTDIRDYWSRPKICKGPTIKKDEYFNFEKKKK